MIKFVDSNTFIRNSAAYIGADVDHVYATLLRILADVLTQFELQMFPKVKTDRFKVESNLVINMHDNCIQPLTVIKVFNVEGNPRCYVLGQKDFVDPTQLFTPSTFECGQTAFVDNNPEEPTTTVNLYNYGSVARHSFYVHPYYYGEFYGKSESHFIGFWQWNNDENRIEFSSENGAVSVGDDIVVMYNAFEGNMMIPTFAVQAVRARVLQLYFMSRDGAASDRWARDLSAQIDMMKRHLENYSLYDIIDSLRRGYSSSIGG